jgi:protein TonB
MKTVKSEVPTLSSQPEEMPVPDAEVQRRSEENKPKTPVLYAQEMPEAGYNIGEFLGANMHYPETARSNNIAGRVTIKFVVNEDGVLSDFQVVRSVGGGCDEEAMRVVKLLPAWKKPGKQDGKAIKVYYTLPIVFKLEDPDPAKK